MSIGLEGWDNDSRTFRGETDNMKFGLPAQKIPLEATVGEKESKG